MDETYRMLGHAHEADLERDAEKWSRAAAVGTRRRGRAALVIALARARGRSAVARAAAVLKRRPLVDPR
jgi:hypothetical protein